MNTFVLLYLRDEGGPEFCGAFVDHMSIDACVRQNSDRSPVWNTIPGHEALDFMDDHGVKPISISRSAEHVDDMDRWILLEYSS